MTVAKLIGPAMLFCVLPASGQTLTPGERQRAAAELQASRKVLLDAIRGLSPAQWNFKPAPGRWSVAECAEHIAVTEDFYYDLVANQLARSPAAPEKKSEAAGKDSLVLNTMADRGSKRVTGESLEPKGRWKAPEAFATHFNPRHDRLIDYVNSTSDSLRDRFRAHRAVGLIDGYQWILLASGHVRRHTAQIEEVKADPGFPRN
jgi:hypothetical protein